MRTYRHGGGPGFTIVSTVRGAPAGCCTRRSSLQLLLLCKLSTVLLLVSETGLLVICEHNKTLLQDFEETCRDKFSQGTIAPPRYLKKGRYSLNEWLICSHC
ncbi:unnamed protein product [Amaranthus hypochondriacus]